MVRRSALACAITALLCLVPASAATGSSNSSNTAAEGLIEASTPRLMLARERLSRRAATAEA